MDIVTSIGNFFRAAVNNKTNPIDRYDILSPLISVQEYVERTRDLVGIMEKNPRIVDLIKNPKLATNTNIANTLKSYEEFVKALPHQFQRSEMTVPFSVIHLGLNSINNNLEMVETQFPSLFGGNDAKIDETNLRTSSLIIIGYIETVSDFCTWLGSFIRLLTADDHDLIPPFEAKSVSLKASKFGSFIGFNLIQWNGGNHGILSTIKSMQKKGADVVIKTEDAWIDTFIHDNQFSPIEKELMGASIRTGMMLVNLISNIKSYRLEFLTAQKQWLVAKIALETGNLSGMDPNTAEYKKLLKATEYYANAAAALQQKIERARS